MSDSPCCAPQRASAPEAPHGDVVEPAKPAELGTTVERSDSSAGSFLTLPGGEFLMGNGGSLGYASDGEVPREVHVASFALSTTAVTNDEFAAFVRATGYRTEAESFGWSFVFGGLLPDDFPDTRGVAAAPWWRQVFDATWAHPEGAQSNLNGRGTHPVIHVSWNDACAYAAWCHARLPTEAEWEYAARSGTTTLFPWGDELEPGGLHRMNVFQGQFPAENTCADGWAGTCPVDAFEANTFGFHNMLGNVWEWTADSFTVDVVDGAIPDPDVRTMKGGSYLCHESYCRRYRASARMGSSADSSAGNVGFRLARSL